MCVCLYVCVCSDEYGAERVNYVGVPGRLQEGNEGVACSFTNTSSETITSTNFT